MSKFSEQIEHLLQYNGIDADTFLEAALSLHSNRKNTGIQKYALELRLMDDLTTQINQAFRNLIIKTITENEKLAPTLPPYETQIKSSNEFNVNHEQKFDELQLRYEDLLAKVSTNNMLIAELTLTVKENTDLMEQNTRALAKLEKDLLLKHNARGSYNKKNKPKSSVTTPDHVHDENPNSNSDSEVEVPNDDDSVP